MIRTAKQVMPGTHGHFEKIKKSDPETDYIRLEPPVCQDVLSCGKSTFSETGERFMSVRYAVKQIRWIHIPSGLQKREILIVF